jgi:PDZ domain-containing protein
VLRAGKQIRDTLLLLGPAAGSSTPRIGITVVQGCLLPFQVTLSLTGIGGPSAGLMFSLGIIDKISTHDLTHGRFIAGTGTIEPSGKVGPIGGIALKMIAARRAGATVFLAPATNCGDVKGNIPSGLDVVKVTTLHDAIGSLDAQASGAPVPHC